jgi:tetratricopeptide (TPR) repeat protein
VTANKVRVSLCMIVRDEQENLDACLAPVAELFDEIVIVDTGSIDATQEIARRYTPHVYEFPWCDDFAAARNESLRRSTGEWIFWLDADDRVRPEQVEKLRTLLEQLDHTPRGYLMETVIVPAVAGEEPAHVTHGRLFRRHEIVAWHGRVHEQLLPELSTLGYEWLFSAVQIEHLGYQNAGVAARKARRKLRLLRMDYAVNPNDPSTLFHLGMSLRRTPQAEEAAAHLRRLLELGNAPTGFIRWACDALVQIALCAGRCEEGIQWALYGLTRFPQDEQLLFSLAKAHFTLQQYPQAASALTQLLAAPPQRNMMFESPAELRTKLAPRLFGTVRRLQKEYSEAESLLCGVLSQFPEDVTTWYDLGLVYLDTQRGSALTAIHDRLLGIPGGKQSAGLLAALWHLRHGEAGQAGPIIDELITLQPSASRPRMLRAEWLSRMGASLEAKIQALRDILRIEPGNVEARRFLQMAMQAQPAAAAPLPAAAMAPAATSAPVAQLAVG